MTFSTLLFVGTLFIELNAQLYLCVTGYEVRGLKNIPSEGGALLIYYHAAVPLDIYYLNPMVYLKRNRTIKNVIDRFIFKTPGS